MTPPKGHKSLQKHDIIQYRPDIDGLRAIAVVAVVLNHLNPGYLPGGYIGVDIFFVISGYLITRIISKEISNGEFTFQRFYIRRARRIFPALFALIGTTMAAASLTMLSSDILSTMKGALGAVTFVSNMVFWREMAAGYFAATNAAINPLLHTWSLSVEEQFYVFFPVLLLLIRLRSSTQKIAIVAAVSLISMTAAQMLLPSKSVAVFFLTPFRLWELGTGAILALQHEQRGSTELKPVTQSNSAWATVGLVAIIAPLLIYDKQTPFPAMAALPPVVGTALLIHTGHGQNSWVHKILSFHSIVYIGLISYSLYLWHWPIIVFTRYFNLVSNSAINNLALGIISILAAILSYRYIETPFRSERNVSAGNLLRWAAGAAITCSALACIAIADSGFQSLVKDNQVLALDGARTQKIPFVSCSDKSLTDLCKIGDATLEPTVILWGDSHALALAPVVDQLLRQMSMGGLLITNSACPPLAGIQKNNFNRSCPEITREILEYIKKNSAITHIALAGYWQTYYKNQSNISLGTNPQKTASGDLDPIGLSLQETAQSLLREKRSIVIVGPVPVFRRDVPFDLAVNRKWNLQPQSSQVATQQLENAKFLIAAQEVLRRHPEVRYVDLLGAT